MKVLVVHWGRNGGGPRFAADAVAGLREAGVQTAYSFSLQSERAALDRDLAHISLPVSTFSSGRDAVLGSPRAVGLARAVRRYAESNEVDCVFAAMEQLWQPALAHAFRRTRIPYLLGMHDAEFHPGDRTVLRQTTRALEVKASDGLLTFSSAVSTSIKQTWNYQADRVWETFLPVRVGADRAVRDEGPLRVGFFGRWQPYKGIPLLIEAARILDERGVPCTIEVRGDGEEPQLSRSDVPQNLLVHRGWTSEDDVERVVSRFDVLIAPYLEASQSGVVPLAAALGVPSIVTPVGGLVQQVRHRETGLVAARSDAEALVDAIVELQSDVLLRRRLARAAEQEAGSRRSTAVFGAAAASAIEDLIALGKRR